MARTSSKLVEFLKWAGAVGGGAAIGAVTVHYVGKALRERDAKAESNPELEEGFEQPALPAASPNPTPVVVQPIAITPVLPSMIAAPGMPAFGQMPSMTAPSPLGPSPELASLRDQMAAREAQRKREKAEREKALEDIQRRFLDDED